MLSFWERASFIHYDYIVIGSGIVGLSTAISIKEKNPNATVAILERGVFPSGASTKNAGFACFGSLTELLNDIEVLGSEAAFQLVSERFNGLKALRNRLGDKAIGYECNGGYELIEDNDMHCLSQIPSVNEWLSPLFDQPVFNLGNEHVDRFGFNKLSVKSLVVNQYEGQVHTGKMMKSLLALAASLQIQIITGAEVKNVMDINSKVEVIVSNNISEEDIIFKANKVAVCTNGFTKQLVKNVELEPGRGVVLVTNPIEGLPFKGCFHIEQGYYYFRNIESRILFGGGRNLFMEEETSTQFEVNQNILKKLQMMLSNIIIPGMTYEVDYSWAGIMAFGKNKQPVVEQHTENVYLGVRLGGMGVAIGTQLGEKLSQMML